MNGGNTTKKQNNDEQNSTYIRKLFKRALTRFTSYLHDNFDRKKLLLRALSLVLLLCSLHLLNKYLYRRLIPLSMLLKEIKGKEYRKIILGKYFVMAFYAKKMHPSSSAPSRSYSIAKMRQIKAQNIFNLA